MNTQGPYRDGKLETIDSLKLQIADLEKDKAQLLKRKGRRQRWKDSICASGRGLKWLFVRSYGGLRGWVTITISLSVVGILASGIVTSIKCSNRQTREFVRGLEPPPIGCAKVRSHTVCIKPDYQLLHCESDGCTLLPLKRPEDF